MTVVLMIAGVVCVGVGCLSAAAIRRVEGVSGMFGLAVLVGAPLAAGCYLLTLAVHG